MFKSASPREGSHQRGDSTGWLTCCKEEAERTHLCPEDLLKANRLPQGPLVRKGRSTGLGVQQTGFQALLYHLRTRCLGKSPEHPSL